MLGDNSGQPHIATPEADSDRKRGNREYERSARYFNFSSVDNLKNSFPMAN
jgi:hypothetical protein